MKIVESSVTAVFVQCMVSGCVVQDKCGVISYCCVFVQWMISGCVGQDKCLDCGVIT